MSKMTRFIAGAVLSLSLLIGTAAFTVQAASLTTAQISAILGLLQSFGADSATIANVQVALGGGGVAPQPSCHTNVSMNLKFGDRGEQVFWLQEGLREEGFAVGNEQSDAVSKSYFGELTGSAVVKFQARYGILQTGYVGPLTRAKLNSLYGCNSAATYLQAMYLSGTASTYTAGQPISLSIKGVEMPGSNPGTPEDGYNVQVYIRDVNNRSSYIDGTNATYNSRAGYCVA